MVKPVPGSDLAPVGAGLLVLLLLPLRDDDGVRAERFAKMLAEDGPAAARRALLLPLPPKTDERGRSSGRPAIPDCPVHVGVPMGTERAASLARRSSSAASAATRLASASMIFGSARTTRLPFTMWSCSNAEWTPARENMPSMIRVSDPLLSPLFSAFGVAVPGSASWNCSIDATPVTLRTSLLSSWASCVPPSPVPWFSYVT